MKEVLIVALVAVLSSTFGLHKAHEVHTASLEYRIVSLERQIEEARAHETEAVDALQRRIASLENAEHPGVARDEPEITDMLATMEHSAEVRHLRELRAHEFSVHDGYKLKQAKEAGFPYDVVKEVYNSESAFSSYTDAASTCVQEHTRVGYQEALLRRGSHRKNPYCRSPCYGVYCRSARQRHQ